VQRGHLGRERGEARRAEASAGSGAGASVGAYLAAQRRLRGISLDELAARTVIPRRNLERLEAGAFEGAPDGFTRGFVRTVAEALGLDPDEAVMRLMQEPAPDAIDGVGVRRARLALVCTGLAAATLLALALLVRLVGALSGQSTPGEAERSRLVYRTNAVRALAEAVRARALPEAAPPPSRTQSPAASRRDP
jgi:transcriptional regulator with XRE-family HTH domain